MASPKVVSRLYLRYVADRGEGKFERSQKVGALSLSFAFDDRWRLIVRLRDTLVMLITTVFYHPSTAPYIRKTNFRNIMERLSQWTGFILTHKTEPRMIRLRKG
jgi:hypothetical protein